MVYGAGSSTRLASPLSVRTAVVPSIIREDVTLWVTGNCPGRSTVTTSPIRTSDAGTSRTTASDPAGIAGDIEPVLNMMSVMWKRTAASVRRMQIAPPIAARLSNVSRTTSARRLRLLAARRRNPTGSSATLMSPTSP